jgi:hypothetical protein
MKLLNFVVPEPETRIEEGYEQQGLILFGTFKMVKYRREVLVDPRVRAKPITVEFEARDHAFLSQVSAIYYSLCTEIHTRNIKFDLPLDGKMFKGCFPLAIVGNKTFEINYDWCEEIMSHRQVYRYKNFPPNVQRFDFTTTAEFLHKLAEPQVQHVIVDEQTMYCLNDDFETFQKHAILASASAKVRGILMDIQGKTLFTDAFLEGNKRWVNENPQSDSARPQFIVVSPDQLQAI